MITRSKALRVGILLLALSSCSERDEPRALASLLAVHSGAAEKSLGGASFQSAGVGDEFESGDKLRTSADGSARIRIVDSQLDLGPSTLLSFGERLEVTGELRPVDGDVELELEVGDVIIRRGSVVRFGDDRFEILVGTAVLERQGDTFELEVGDSLVLEVGSATVERASAPVADADAGVDAGAASASANIRVTVTGRAATAQAAGAEKRTRLTGDATLEPGTTVRLPRRSRAEIARGGERVSLEGPAVVVAGAEDGALVAMRSGSATAIATSDDVILELPGGRLVLEAGPGDGSAATVSVSRRGTRVAVRRGLARIDGDGGGSETLRHGEAAAIDRKGGVEVSGRAPEFADAELRGDASVHSRTRAVALRIDFSKDCPEDGVVEVAGRRGFDRPAFAGRGTGGVNVRFDRGTSRYRVRCVRDGVIDDEVAFTGTVRVDRDLGTRKIARVPPTSTVEADGRRYTVLYQNKLPSIVFSWRDAPSASAYQLVVERKGARPRTFESSTPRITLETGALREGDYSFRFESSRGASRATSLRIAFDNAASSAYISSPALREAWRGDSILVEGATLPGWRVRANGVELSIDGQQRFRRRVPRPADGRLGIEFVHPRRGRHIYIRRSADPS